VGVPHDDLLAAQASAGTHSGSSPAAAAQCGQAPAGIRSVPLRSRRGTGAARRSARTPTSSEAGPRTACWRTRSCSSRCPVAAWASTRPRSTRRATSSTRRTRTARSAQRDSAPARRIYRRR